MAYAAVVPYLHPLVQYIELGVSSPNTPGLRKLQGKEWLGEIIKAVHAEMERFQKRKPLYVKIAPDLSLGEIDDIPPLTPQVGQTS